jgi:hypothetical protein
LVGFVGEIPKSCWPVGQANPPLVGVATSSATETDQPASALLSLSLSTYPGPTITGIVGRTYRIESSPNMSNWTPQATLLLNSSPYLWFDQSAANGKRFYRAFLLP